MSRYSGISEDFYINLNLNTETDLPSPRDAVVHYFERVQKQYPDMRNFYCRDRNEFVLEESKDSGKYRWASVETRRIASGYVNPDNVDDAIAQHEFVLELVPYLLTVSPLDCESLNLMFGFDYTYRGNHNELLAETLGVLPAFEKLTNYPGAVLISHEPSIQLALDEECRLQCRLSFETRTSAYHVRTTEFPEEQLSVYVTARRYGSLNPGETYLEAMQQLSHTCQEIVDDYVVDHILQPLQQAIAIR